MKTLSDLFDKFESRGQAPAVIYRTAIRRFVYSYKEIYDLSLRMAAWLEGQGVAKGDRVIIWAPNSPWWMVAFWGAMRRGAVIVPVDFTSQRERVQKIKDLTNPKLILQSQYKLDKLTDLETKNIEDLEYLLADIDPSYESAEIQPEDTAELIYTSGTTGDPKGVMLTHKNLISNLLQVHQRISINNEFKFLSLLPLSHMFEQTGGFFTPLLVGSPIVYIRTLKPSAIMDAFAEEDIYVAVIVPRLLQLLKRGIERRFQIKDRNLLRSFLAIGTMMPPILRKVFFYPIRKRFGRNFQIFVSGGAPLDSDVAEFWVTLGFKVVEGYGLTECSPVLTVNGLDRQSLGTVGQPLVGVDLQIKEGQVLAKGDNIFSGYYQNEKATEEVFNEDGWFKTGDLGEFDEEGNLRIKGRLKDLIVTGAGVNIYPEDVEREIFKVAGVKEATVVGIDRGSGEEVHAVLVLENNLGIDTDNVIRQANSYLDPLQQITSHSLWPEAELPKTTTLKVQKFKVKQKILGLSSASPSEDIPQDRLISLVSRVTERPIKDIKEESLLVSDLGLTSVARLELVSLVEQEYRLDLEDTMIDQNTTVKRLRQIVLKREHHDAKDHLRTWPNEPWARSVRKIFDLLITGRLFYHYVDLKTLGLENIGSLKSPALFISNHVSYFDHPAIYFSLPSDVRSRLATAAWEEYFFPQKVSSFTKIWKRFCFEYGSIGLNLFTLPQSRGFRKTLAHMGKLLDRNINILVFPEGERTTNNEMLPMQPGLALMIRELKVPVIPVKIEGVEAVMPVGQALPKKGRVWVKFGKPLHFKNESTEEILETCRKAILGL